MANIINMDVNKILKTVHNLNDYISATQEVINKHSNSKLQFNMSAVLSLKKIRSFEIEYFNKCDESGAGVKILELMLRLPPSKVWSLLGKEIVLLIQYWLDAIRKHLILHNNHWWSFLSTLLKFIQEICSKHTVLSNILVQDLSECLLDLATNPQPTVIQRIKVLQCYNSVCAESSREIRYALRNKFASYFVKLSSILPSCGDIRAQFSIMETLLRWLLPRQDAAVKLEAAAAWFSQSSYSESARRIFIERNWQDFFKDARDFLNAQNTSSDLITTVTCRSFCVGNITLISEADEPQYVDLNASSSSLSLWAVPMLSRRGGGARGGDVLISEDNTTTLSLHRESLRVCISIRVINPRLLDPSSCLEHSDVRLVVGSRSDLVKLDDALRRIFGTKYQLLMDLKQPPPMSPIREERLRTDDITESTRCFKSVQLFKRRQSGYIVRPKLPLSWKSPSTASTSSLALLRDKLTAFPFCNFDKEPVSVCAVPQLSSVTEVTEDERQSLDASLSTYKLRTYGVCNNKSLNRTSRSDERENKCKSPINVDEKSLSCLLVATIGSNDSVINDTVERLPKDKELHTDNIVELLAQEALNSSDTKQDSRIVAIEKTHSDFKSSDKNTMFRNEKPFVSNSATDVSSTDVVEDTQFINDGKGLKTVSIPSKEKPKQTTHDIQAVEDFFSQHFTENRNGDLLISPSLAKKINETSSESSLDFDFRAPMIDVNTHDYDVIFNFDNADIVECLNDMVDKVCKELEKRTEYLTKKIKPLTVCDKVTENLLKISLKEISEKAKSTNKKLKKNTQLKLQYNNTKTVKTRGKKQNKLTEEIKRVITNVEKDTDVEKRLFKNSSTESNHRLNDYETQLIRRKRKLYSPKDDKTVNEKSGTHISETEDDYFVLTEPRIVDKTPKTLATSYKDIEKIRRTSARNLRNRKSRNYISPRNKQNNDIFDNLKKTVEGDERITLAEKINGRSKNLAVYNFSSDSEGDFQKKTKLSAKSTNTVGGVESAKSTRTRKSKGRNVISKERNKEKKNKNVKRRNSKLDIKQKTSDPTNDMIDERIREAATEALNTSLVIDKPHGTMPEVLEPVLHEKPQMEIIEDANNLPARRTTRRKKLTNLTFNKEKLPNRDKNVSSDKEQSVRSSPLPGLIIETIQVQIHKDPDDSITVNAMLEKYKDIYRNEPLPDVSEINTTHNLLSDLDHINYDSNLNISEEYNMNNGNNPFCKRLRNEITNESPKAKKSKIITLDNNGEIEPQIINLSDESEVKSDKSIATLGKSPITGHGECDESPPNTDQLKENFEPRGLETQDLNESMKDYFNKLTEDIYNVSQNSHSEIILDKSTKTKKNKKSIKSINKEKKTSNVSPTVSITRLSQKEIGQWLPNRFNSIFGSNQSSETEHPVRITRSHTKSQGGLRINDPNAIAAMSSKLNFRKSAISPIIMFCEENKERLVTSEKNDFLDHIKNILTSNSENLKTGQFNTKSNTSKKLLKSEKSDKIAISTTSRDVGYKSNKRQSSSVSEVTKKGETETPMSDFESGHASSINDWFNRNELQKQKRDYVKLSLKENLENIMEKLETTLTEIHLKTSNKFVSMFVEAQKHLTDLKEQRRQLYKQTALEVISDIVKLMDVKFGELDCRSQDLDQQYIEGVKKSASNVMRADCQQKRVMVSLLQEDIGAVLNHINKDGQTNL